MACYNGRRHARIYSFLDHVEETTRHVERITAPMVRIVAHIVTIITMIAMLLTGSSTLHQIAEFLG